MLVTGYWAGHNYLTNYSNGRVINLNLNEQKAFIDHKANPKELRVLTWNIGYFYGLGSEGTAYYPKEFNYYQKRLESAVRLIKKEDIDLVFLQEVDFNSGRTHFVDQLKEMAKALKFSYIAYAPSWEANYIPYPYWPVTRHFGKIQSGGGIISRYPIKSNKIKLLNKPRSNSWWYNYFYLYRYIQKAKIAFGTRELIAYNVHLEAFDKKNRYEQLEKLLEEKNSIDLLAGDFNLIPNNAKKRSHFAGYPEDDYINDQSFEKLTQLGLSFSNLTDLTFPAHRPDRKLDYVLFNNQKLKVKESRVLNAVESDHLPVLSILEFNN